jgi:cytidylate kinase
MAIITLSWQLGSYADLIAADVVARLQDAAALPYRIIGKQELHDMLMTAGEYFADDVVNVENGGIAEFSRAVEGEIQPDFFFRTHQNSSFYSSLLMSLIYKAASQDRILLEGFGAHLLLSAYPQVLSVRLQGSLQSRIAILQDRRHLSPQAAKALIKKDKRNRMGFVQYLFNRELIDTQSFDLMIAVDKLDRAAIVDMIVRAAQTVEQQHPMTAERQTELLTRGFACRIEAVIQKMGSNITGLMIDVSPDYTVTMSGNVVQKSEKIRIEERVRKISGVQGVNNQMTVGSPFGRNNGRRI